MLTNWRTTLTAVIGAVAALVAAFGIQVSTEVQIAIVTVVVFFVGIFARDGNQSEDDL